MGLGPPGAQVAVEIAVGQASGAPVGHPAPVPGGKLVAGADQCAGCIGPDLGNVEVRQPVSPSCSIDLQRRSARRD
jgi:hypothetical protein